MKNKTYSKNYRKKSIASFFLALLLTLSFNSSPIMLMTESLRNANAYKATDSQTYYSKTDSTEEKNFGDANFPASLSKYFEGSSKNFNISKYYLDKFETIYREKVDAFFANYNIADYQTQLEHFLTHFGLDPETDSLSDLYVAEKDNFIKLNFENPSYQNFVEKLATEGFHKYDNADVNAKSILPITNEIQKVDQLSDFYRMVANFVKNESEDVDSAEHPNRKITSFEAFYKTNTHYLRLKNYIDAEIAKNAPSYAFDGTTQDTNIAAIFADNAPSTVKYNYVSNSYEKYTTPSASYSTFTNKVSDTLSETKNYVYYFGNKNLASLDTYKSLYEESVAEDYLNEYTHNSVFFQTKSMEEKETVNVLFYRLIEDGEFGYLGESIPTYYKYSGSNTPYIKTNSSLTSVYVLDDTPTQSELDTINSVFFNHITSEILASEPEFYIPVPFEDDELYFKAVYGNLLHSKKAFDYETFKAYFRNGDGSSKLYFKLGATELREVYILDTDLPGFKTNYPDYKYLTNLNTFSAGYNPEDYELIISNTSGSGYLPKNTDGKPSYNLYFAKEKSYYYDDVTTSSYGDLEKTYAPIINLEKQPIASINYEPVTDGSTERKIYVLNEAESTIELDSVVYPCVKQTDIDSNPNFYVAVPTALYPNNIDSNTYKLYYKHAEVFANKIYVVDNADNASENKVYKTLNYNVIGSKELEDNYSNYIAIVEGDDNYNKNFQLYYKYLREPVVGSFYILKEDVVNNPSLDNYNYKTVGGGELSDYKMLDKTTYSTEYGQVMSDLGIEDIEKIHLYFKLSDIFVQNGLTGKNAIYVIDSSISSSEKEDYMQNGYTAIEQKEVDNNKELYVAVSEKDPHYRNDSKLKLYYRYIQSPTASNKVYSFDGIDTTAKDFDKDAYVLIQSGQKGYKVGAENYYKKTLISTTKTEIYNTPTYYYYQTSKTVSLTADSYYAISFYVQTLSDASASFYIKDTANAISDIKLENIKTNGAWEQYYVFISTNVNTASTINLYLYLGDETNGIVGNSGTTTLSGSIFFDDIKITKIGLTDYNKFAINDKQVYLTPLTTGEDDAKTEVEGAFADSYNNRVYIANLESIKASDARFETNTYEFKNYLDTANNDFATNWNKLFNFDDNNNTELKNLLGFDSSAEDSDKISNSLADIGENDEGKNMYDSSFTSLWRYYLSRDLTNEFALDQYRQAYNNDKLEVSITNKIEESEEPDEDEKDDTDKKDDEDEGNIVYVSSPFKEDNYALKLTNNHKDISLGITSNSFTVKQFEYYKISLWIYSPNIEGTATISVNSVLKTRQKPTYGSLLSSSISSVSANIEKSTNKNEEYGWIPVTLFIEGNNFEDMECYLVLSAGADSTVYFDNIRIEKTTSAKYDDASSNSSSNKYTCALSLIPSSSIASNDVKNGSFDYIKETSTDHNLSSIEPYAPDSWTATSTNSKRVTAGVVSPNQTAFFTEYADGNYPKEITDNYTDDYSNIYAIYAPSEVTALDGITKINYLHTYSIYSGSLSLSANTIYKLSFKYYKGADFEGSLFANIYLSAVKPANIVSTMEIADEDIKTNWQTYTFYIATGSSSSTAYIEIGVKDATGISFIKNVTSKKLTNKTMNGLIADVAKENGVDNSSTEDIYNKLKHIRFLNLADINFSNHTPSTNDKTNLFDQSLFSNKTEMSTSNTVGQNGVAVATYFDTIYTTNYSVTINKVTYYIGEVYTLTISDTKYYVQKTYNSEKNVFEYTVYSDDDLINKVTKINGEDISIETTDGVKVKVGSNEPLETETTYRLYRFSDLREEVRVLDGSPISVPSLDKVIVGVGSNKTENTATSSQIASYEYHFGSSAKKDFVINNTIIPASELNNAQSSDVLILSNSYSTDYITLSQASTKTLGKSSYNILRIYVKTSDFASDDFGLNINIKAVNVEWKNINTTNSTQKDKFGFVCYEILIKSNSTDSISDFGVQLSLGDKDNTGTGYAIISKISLTTLSSADEFEHYSELVGDDNENIKKAFYDEKPKSDTSADDSKTDDKNSVSWATFFYIFSSLLLVITMAVAMIAIIFKKHPVKLAQKYSNEHERDIETTKSKSSKKKSPKNSVIIGELNEEKRQNKNSGGIE